MITTFLIEHRWIPPVLLALLVLLGPPVAAWLASRPGLLRVAAALSFVPVLVLTLLPSSRRAFQVCEVAFSVPTVGRVELFANVVLFVAPALLLGVLWRRPLLAGAVAIGASAAIEALQAAVPRIGRSCSTNDLLSNAIGAVLGALLAQVAVGLGRREPSRTA